MKLTTKSPDETMATARRLAKKLKAGDIICLSGNLGCGKTTFVKGLASGMKINVQKVHSPTFVLMNMYEGKLPLYHFDLYRMENIDEMHPLGYEEFIYGDGVAVIEWAERILPLLAEEYLEIQFLHKSETARSLNLIGRGKRYSELLKGLKLV